MLAYGCGARRARATSVLRHHEEIAVPETAEFRYSVRATLA
jgi:hypothetical protein